MSPALAGRFSTTAPPGKPYTIYFYGDVDSFGYIEIYFYHFILCFLYTILIFSHLLFAIVLINFPYFFSFLLLV